MKFMDRVPVLGRVCHKCAVRLDPICANSLLFNATVKRFRAGLIIGKRLICKDVGTSRTASGSPTLNQ